MLSLLALALVLGGVEAYVTVVADDMVRLDGGVFAMGSNAFYPEEGPVHEAQVGPFELDRYAVTNRQFTEFVTAEAAPRPRSRR